ncbi:MAG: YceD family protein [Pseudomonadota bacterium]
MSVRFVIDPLDFVRNAGIRHGKIPLADFLRLQDFLFDSEGDVLYQINGEYNKNGKPGLQLKVSGTMHLCCQRCLGRLEHTIDLQTFLLLATSETELNKADDDDSVDAILAVPEIDVLDLIEDELILGLPISSRHQDGECEMQKSGLEEGSTGKTTPKNPFAVLATLKKMN